MTRTKTTLPETTWNDLDGLLRGRSVSPHDVDYDDVRSLYNAMIDKRPGRVAQCRDVADVIAATNFAREHGIDVAVRSGGHNGPGLALCDDGLVIDLSSMKGCRVDPVERVASVEPGCTWGDVDHATHAFGLATVSGILSTTGVGGLTLGGGHGYLSRRFGLTIDNLRSADVVLPEGRFVRASADEEPELFWALRGGGGNFGVVTSFEYDLHPVANVIGGPLFWPLDRLESLLQWYREWLPGVDRDLYAFFAIAEIPPEPPFPSSIHGRKVCGLVCCSLGSRAATERELDQARAVAPPLFEHVGEIPYPRLQSLFDGLYPPGLQWYWKGDFFRELSDEAIAELVRHGEVPTPHSTLHLYPIDGAVHEVEASATAFPHRDVTWSMVVAGVDPQPANVARIRDWARETWSALHPHSAGASYVNFLMEEGKDRIEATYGTNFERLRQAKARYDPANVFHVNQNVEPR